MAKDDKDETKTTREKDTTEAYSYEKEEDDEEDTNNNNKTVNSSLLLQDQFRDHFTLSTPSSLIRFRSSPGADGGGVSAATRIIDVSSSQTQFVLEENKERKIQLKQLGEGTTVGVQFLRGTYTIMCFFWTGIFLVLCLQILLVMVLEMAVATGYTTIDGVKPLQLIGILLGILVLTYSFAMAMVIATAFCGDVWKGHTLLKLFFFRAPAGNVFVDWIFLTMFVLVPAVTACSTLFARMENAWEVITLVWYSSVSVVMVVFSCNVVYFELQGALKFLQKEHGGSSLHTKWQWIRMAVLLRQRAAFSGYRTIKYIARSDQDHLGFMIRPSGHHEEEDNHVNDDPEDGSRHVRIGLYSRLTRLPYFQKKKLYTSLDPPQPVSTLQDIQEDWPYVTKHTWTLEGFFFRPRQSKYIVVVEGPGALTQHQMTSSLVCKGLGTALVYALILAVLVWMHFPTVLIVGLLVVCLLLMIPLYKDTRRMIHMMKAIVKVRNSKERIRKTAPQTIEEGAVLGEDDEDLRAGTDPSSPHLQTRRASELAIEEPNQGIYLVSQQERITQASDILCWTMLAVEVVFYYLIPIVALFWVGNIPLACLYVIVATISGMRRYINLLAVVEETGHLNHVTGANFQIRWHKQSRLNDLIQAISSNKARRLWQWIFLGVGGIWVALFIMAAPQTVDSTRTDKLTFVQGYSWQPLPDDVRYSTCELSKETIFGSNTSLADYALMAQLSYKTDEIAKEELDGWFHNVNVTEDLETVNTFRSQKEYQANPVFFRLFRFHLDNGLDRGVVSIRGTTNAWDLLADNQLWSAAMLMQTLRVVLPIGEMWTPILDNLINMMSFFQRSSVEQVSFYKVTTPFVKALKEDPSFESVQLTGHSLGGGIAMISSAQSKVPSIALSGPNSVLSGKSFDPKVTPEELNQYTLNVVPDRDLVPRFDDLAKNYQRIRCTTEPHNVLGCHSAARAFCEIVTTCGNTYEFLAHEHRPAVCQCVFEFGYDPPTADNPTAESRSFKDACVANGYTLPDEQ